uniref:Transcription termination factor 3, mitochondrial n=1 Tax=Culicoides sonorensis TaxID=179676 RepID=A0A336LP71_CULSO
MIQRNILSIWKTFKSSNILISRACHLQKIEELSEKELQEFIDDSLIKPDKSLIEPGGATVEDEIAPFIKPTFNLAAYANKSHTLKQFLDLGVDLHKIEKRKGLGQFVLQLEFDKHVKDHLLFLKDVGVSPDIFGEFITKNPLIFKENIDDLQTRVNYLQSKTFTSEMIVRIIEKNPFWLMFSTKRIDRRLGFFQKTFLLNGNEVRFLSSKQPRLITYNVDHVRKSYFVVKEEMGFEKEETKSLVLAKPRLFMMNHDSLLNRFEYVHHTMKLPHETILKSPEVLTTRLFKLKERHEFLHKLRRDQYDPKKPLYVSLYSLVTASDKEFIENIAKSCTEEYEKFLKTL